MKLLPIILIISFICYSISATRCEDKDAKDPSNAKECNERSVDTDEYCCYIKGELKMGYLIQKVRGCIRTKKKEIDNGAIEKNLKEAKESGSDFSLDCNSSYITIGFLIILFLLV